MSKFCKYFCNVSSLAVLTVCLALGIYWGWLSYTAPNRVEPGLLERAQLEGSIPAQVVLPFKPERFHVAKIQAEGKVRRVTGNVVELRSISADGIKALATKYYWIERINGV